MKPDALQGIAIESVGEREAGDVGGGTKARSVD